MSGTFNAEEAIRSVKREMEADTAKYEKRQEFWRGYLAAMEEVHRHLSPEKHPQACGRGPCVMNAGHEGKCTT